jgi:HEAT repeat protein
MAQGGPPQGVQEGLKRVCLMLPDSNFKYFLAGIFLLVLPYVCSAEPSLEEIKAEFKHRDMEGRMGLLQKLEGIRDEETVDFLMAVVSNRWGNWHVEIRAIELLGKAENPKAVDLLLKIFASRSLHYSCPAIKTYTAVALGNFRENDRIQEALVRCIQDDEPQVREACVQSLGKTGDTRTVPFLILLLNDHSIAVRLSAIDALETRADPQAVAYLERLSTEDSDEIVRSAARSSLKKFNNR